MENFRKIKVTDLNMLFHHYLYSRCDFLSYKLILTKINTLESVLVFGGRSWYFVEKSLKKKGGGRKEKKKGEKESEWAIDSLVAMSIFYKISYYPCSAVDPLFWIA